MYLTSLLLVTIVLVVRSGHTINAQAKPSTDSVDIAKCCEPNELLLDGTCTLLTETNETEPWKPEFVDAEDRGAVVSITRQPSYQLKIGSPGCNENEHPWLVYYHPNGPDRLVILTTGKLRHYIDDLSKEPEDARGIYDVDYADLNDKEHSVLVHHDYEFGHYCADKAILTTDKIVATYAKVCVPDIKVQWSDADYLLRNAIDPTFHAISVICYLIVAIVYFVLPQLRDLIGNMITSLALCMIVNQCGSIVRIFTQFGNHISFFIADTVTYVSLLATFFWLNALGYYVWNTFRSRNVFLRLTDGKKYCYYSLYVWSSTVCIAGTAIFAHLVLETNKPSIGGTVYPPQETVGWLGISILFTAVAFIIIVNLCFVLTTTKKIRRMSSYGRIHHKMKYTFRMFVLLYLIMSANWISLSLSKIGYNVLIYGHIVVNLLQALLVLYVCVFGQKRVTFLLGKTCNCCNVDSNQERYDWGEEMTAINAGY